MTRPDPDTLDIAEFKRRDLDEWRRRHGGINNDWYSSVENQSDPVTIDLFGAIIAGTVFFMAIIGALTTAHFIVGLFL